jgi:hypothetical protein
MNTTILQRGMLALVASIYVLNAEFDQRSVDVAGRDKPDHDGRGRRQPCSP